MPELVSDPFELFNKICSKQWLSSDWFQSCSHIFDIRKWYTAARSIRLIKIRFILWNLLSPDHHHFSWRPMFIKIDLRCNHNDNYSINEHRENKTKPNRIYLLVCISEPMSNSYIASDQIVLLWKCFPVSHRWANIVGKSPAELHVGHIYQREKNHQRIADCICYPLEARPVECFSSKRTKVFSMRIIKTGKNNEESSRKFCKRRLEILDWYRNDAT